MFRRARRTEGQLTGAAPSLRNKALGEIRLRPRPNSGRIVVNPLKIG
jgi:hypothetical protein